MAIPANFAQRVGVALMRQNVASGEWFLVRWVAMNATDVTLDAPGPGNYRYELWLVIGGDQPELQISSLGWEIHSVVVMETKR